MHRDCVEGGNHVDRLYDEFPERLQPIALCYRSAFIALESRGESSGRRKRPGSKAIPMAGAVDPANVCSI